MIIAERILGERLRHTTKFGVSPDAVYLGANEMMTLKDEARFDNGMLSLSLKDGGRLVCCGMEVFEVNAKSHFSFSCRAL